MKNRSDATSNATARTVAARPLLIMTLCLWNPPREILARPSPLESAMLTLYHAPQSRSTRFLWLLEELGADYKIAYTNIPRRDGSGAIDPANPHPDKKVP